MSAATPQVTPRTIALRVVGDAAKEYAAKRTSEAMSTTSDSDMSMPSLIHMNG